MHFLFINTIISIEVLFLGANEIDARQSGYHISYPVGICNVIHVDVVSK